MEKVKEIALDRNQLRWEELDLEQLIPEDHAARLIWNVSGQMNLSLFEKETKTKEGMAGRPCWPSRALVSIWVYAYTLGVASGRAIARMMSHEPGLRWLVAGQEINHHTLSDFRVGHEEALTELFAQFLAILESSGMVDLGRLLHDGTKVRAVAGSRSMHRRKTLEKRVRLARKVVRKLVQKAAESGEGLDERQRAAQERAAREAWERAQAALKKLRQLEAETTTQRQADLRVSESEPEARKMKHADGSWGPSYNVQVTTEAQSRMIVGIHVTTAANDTQELMPALEKVKKNTGEAPETVVADNGYATRSNVEASSAQNISLVAPWKEDGSREAGACKRNGIAPEFAGSKFRTQPGGKKLTCPAGQSLVVVQQKVHHGVTKNIFEARASDCRRCRWVRQCCGKRGGARRVERVVESAAMKEYLARMKRPETRKLYKKRCEIAEFPHLWAKAVKKWRRFSVRGLVKAGMEALWVALAYNVTQWIRLKTSEPAAA